MGPNFQFVYYHLASSFACSLSPLVLDMIDCNDVTLCHSQLSLILSLKVIQYSGLVAHYCLKINLKYLNLQLLKQEKVEEKS